MQSEQRHFKRTQLFFWLFLAILGAACRPDQSSEEVVFRQSKIFVDFFVRYLAPEQQLRGQASFWEGVSRSNLQPVIPEGSISFDGEEMEAKRLPGSQIRFSLTEQKTYKDSLAFRFRMPDGRYLQYELNMTPVRDFFIKGNISKSEGATFVINGGLMNENEEIILMFTDEEFKATAITVKGPTSNIEISVSPEQLQALTPGPGQLYLVKKLQKQESHPNLELTAAVEYYTDSRAIEVIE
ncbi:MAG: hypothetical protein R2824_19460 [Saprospiraceae bacterium]|nr:hypothetical protein [Lewinella sp.]